VITPREAVEQTILLSIGAASLTRERVEGIVADFVKRGHLGTDEGRAVVDRVMSRVRGEAGGAASSSVVDRIEGGVQALLKEVGVARKDEVSDLEMRLDALEHRIALLEKRDDVGVPTET
jgi:polyhydroxyalkanoate synthesis regulator phasin